MRVFELLRKLGHHLREVRGNEELDQIADEIGEDYKSGLAICFDEDGSYEEVRLTKREGNVLYKYGSPRGNDYTLVSRTSGTTENVVPRLKRNAKKIIDWATDREDLSIDLLERCLGSAKAMEEQIQNDILETYPPDAGASNRVYAYWAVLRENAPAPFWKTDLVKQYLADQALEDYARRSSTKKRMLDEDGSCSVCGESSVTVYGNFSEVATYNIDKPGLITGGFDYAQTPNNFPVCRSCILDVLGGKTFAESDLDFYVGGLDYWLLPDASNPQVYKKLLEDLESADTRQSLGTKGETLTNREDEILGWISHNTPDGEGEGQVTLNLFFYESSQASWRIISEVRRVLPSRVNDLYKFKEQIEDDGILVLTEREAESGYHFTLRTLQQFTDDPRNDDVNREFLRYVEALFKEETLDRDHVLRGIARSLLDAQKQSVNEGSLWPIRYRARDAWVTYRFLQKADAIPEDDSMTDPPEGNSGYATFMNENPGFFGDPERRASFLTGCFVGSVMYAQQQERDSQPFVKKFIGRKLDRDRLRYLYNEGKEKLTHYDKRGLVHKLDDILAESWVEVGSDWSLSEEETTFAFNLGWTLNSQLATLDDTEEDQE